ncbi:MAG TPA: heavy-metal-associated domain-containing protein [Ideonella sp.]|uniref:heavy-metal-associated domain-containing protein n=1 Tax=Ideonella sp. TaxID=1929293 RepID=UPI002E30841E|nr:heavy-metal-associated domain-containing protein [Ideonella sp.]HEX5686522.1 heavy-metal-associated domain-containing protein [Ideonella sp.]
MIAFDVNDMSCGHCVGAITQAVTAADPGAQVEVDLANHRVTIQPALAGEQALAQAIREAGYTPQPVS